DCSKLNGKGWKRTEELAASAPDLQQAAWNLRLVLGGDLVLGMLRCGVHSFCRSLRMNTVWQDLRYAVRRLAKSPGFTAASVLTLAIGIGINTALFSNMDAVVLHPLAVPRLDRVVTVGEQEDRKPSEVDYLPVALADY